MNLIPKNKSLPPTAGEEDQVWDELPPPPTFDAEEEWSKETETKGPRTGVRRKLVKSKGPGCSEEAVRLSVRSLEPAFRQVEFEPVSAVPPDARLLLDDLRMEDSEDHPQGADKSQGPTARWIFYAGVLVISVVFGALGLLTLLEKSNPKVNPLGVPPLVIDQEEKYPRGEHIADLLARKDEAIGLFGQFLQTEANADMSDMLRSVPSMAILAGHAHRPEGLPAGWQVPVDAKWDVHTDQDPVFGVLSGYYPDDRKFQAFFTLESGRLWLDWKATMCYGSSSFSELAKGEGTAAEIRVWVEPASFYPLAFPESDYRSYKLHTSWDDPAVWAFVRRGTVQEQKLTRIFHKSMFGGDKIKASMVLLSLARGSAEAAPNQWLITDLLHTAWVLP